MGADAVLSFEDAQDAVVAELGGLPDIVVECVGKPGMLEKAIAHVRVTGTVISLGLCLQREPIVAAHCGFKGLKICFRSLPPSGSSLRLSRHSKRAAFGRTSWSAMLSLWKICPPPSSACAPVASRSKFLWILA